MKFSQHAIQRCAEMGFSTKRAKRVLKHPETDFPNYGARAATKANRRHKRVADGAFKIGGIRIPDFRAER